MDINLNITIHSPILTELLHAAGVSVASAPKGNAPALIAPVAKAPVAAETTAKPAVVEKVEEKAAESAKEEKKAEKPKSKKAQEEAAKSASEEEKAAKAKAEALAFDESADLDSTLENCRLIAKKLSFVFDLDSAHSIIKSFGVAKIQDLPEDKYEDFIDDCKKKLSEKPAAKAADNMFD